MVNELCRVCPKCGIVIECDDDEQEENRGRSSTATNFHLKKKCFAEIGH